MDTFAAVRTNRVDRMNMKPAHSGPNQEDTRDHAAGHRHIERNVNIRDAQEQAKGNSRNRRKYEG
jgi:hypothetical protein